MVRVRLVHAVLFLTALALLAGTPAAHAADSPGGVGHKPEAPAKDPQTLADRIDQLLEARWAAAGVQPASRAGDAEFLRRVWLDLVGTIPPVADVRTFLEDRRPDKRQRMVQRLLQSPGYVTHFSQFWRAVLLPENANVANFRLDFALEGWLRGRLRQNVAYDQIVRDLLTAGQVSQRERVVVSADGQDGPQAFYQANENKPENLAGSTARLFLAVKLECAQCHNHPHAAWKQEEFWQYAAFFSSGQGKNGREIRIPKTGQLVQARFPDGGVPEWKSAARPVTVLADWMMRADNRYFARAAVNRVWASFFGAGLVEPVDDLTQAGEDEPVLDELAREFVKQRYDLKYLIQGIVLSRAYQLTSVASTNSQDDVRHFARLPLRALAPEQIFASLADATGIRALTPDLATRFARQDEKPTEAQTSILQALTLMNGKFIDDATRLDRSETLAAVANAPFLDTAGKIETLYLAALSREPRPEESVRLVKYVDRGGPSGDPDRALADVFWALLNSGEFLLNH